VASLVVLMLLLPFIVMYIAIGLGKAFGARMGQLAAKLVPEEEIAMPQVEALRIKMHRMLGWAKLGVGLLGFVLGMYALVSGAEGLSIGYIALVVVLAVAFRNGADLSTTLVYARHDARVIRSRRSEVSAGRLLAPVLAISVSASALFIVLWAIVFFLVQVGAKTALGVSVNQWTVMLWTLGLISGAVAARTVARKESRFLLKNELGVAIFLGLVRLQTLGKARRGLLGG
jgi:hypothetical protein